MSGKNAPFIPAAMAEACGGQGVVLIGSRLDTLPDISVNSIS